MIRIVPPLLAVMLLAACDQPRTVPRATPSTQGFDNSAASQSIMQPKVIAESPPTPEPPPTAPPPLPRATVLFVQGARLDDTARAALDALLADPALPADATLVLRGHSDSPGSDQANLATSRRRALAARAYLEAKGVAADRITVIALGERRPVAPNAELDGSDDPTGRARNRRVDVEVVRAIVPAPAATPLPTPTPAASPATD